MAWVRLWTPSLPKMLFPCFFTVPRLTTSRSATARLEAPAAIRPRFVIHTYCAQRVSALSVVLGLSVLHSRSWMAGGAPATKSTWRWVA